MEQNDFAGCEEIIKHTALDTTPTRNNMAYYAVANGAKPGIYDIW
jgi:viroplasmin and RNaseH domain-containing protein